jgi:hypothetical protein
MNLPLSLSLIGIVTILAQDTHAQKPQMHFTIQSDQKVIRTTADTNYQNSGDYYMYGKKRSLC